MLLTDYTSGNAGGQGYNVRVVFDGALWTEDLQQAFVLGADYLSSVITENLASITADFGDGQGVRTIDDLEITATLQNIDGLGGVLGAAGPQYYRTADLSVINGAMNFDLADAEWLYTDSAAGGTGGWNEVVLHEMLHVVGFGTMWELMGLVTDVGVPGAPDYRYTGATALAEYWALFPKKAAADPFANIGVPLESQSGSPATDGGHWAESAFNNELMTGYLDGTNYLSNMTLAALEDMGLQTTYAASTSPLCFVSGTLLLTDRGPRPVEFILPGARVATLDNGWQTLRAVNVMQLDTAWLARHPRHRPIRIAAGSLGMGLPQRDLMLSPQHRILVASPILSRMTGQEQMLVAVKDLLDLPGVARLADAKTVRYFHLTCDRHELVHAEGLAAETRLPKNGKTVRPVLAGQLVRGLVRRSMRNAKPLTTPFPARPVPLVA